MCIHIYIYIFGRMYTQFSGGRMYTRFHAVFMYVVFMYT